MKRRIEKKYRNIKRYKQISTVFAKYGFSIISDKLTNKGFGSKSILRINTSINQKYSKEQRLRMALEELGPTFIKLGQILSTRYDILPKNVVKELTKLQDNVKIFDLEVAQNIFKDELKIEINDVFKEFDKKPIAAASIGQVYKGILKDGNSVIVKIQRPNIQKIIETDLDILYNIASLLNEHIKKKITVSFVDIVDEFANTLKKELNYTYEAQNCENFRVKFKNDKRVVIPKVFWKYTTKRVLMTEKIEGIKLSNIDKIEKQKIDTRELSHIGAKVFMEQIFIHGYFHGDPHPGNLFVVDKNKIGFIDFGVVGYLDKDTLDFVVNLLRSAVNKDVTRIIEGLYKINAITSTTDEDNLKKDLYYLINYYYNIPFDKLNFGEALNDILRICYKNKVKIPIQLISLIKSIITIEGTAKKLNPDFNLTQISSEVLKDLKIQKYNPKRILKDLSQISINSIEDIKELPRLLKHILDMIEKNNVKITMKQEGLKQLEKEINIMTNKLSLSLIVSSIIVGSSIVIQSKTGPTILGMSAFGLIGFTTAAFLGIFLVVSILINIWKHRN